MDAIERANGLWWATYRQAVADYICEHLGECTNDEVDRYATAEADKAREKFMEEAKDFTTA